MANKKSKKQPKQDDSNKTEEVSNKKITKSSLSHLFKKRSKNFGIGRDMPFKKDLSKVMKWPKYIQTQKRKAILKKRIKIPPPIALFSHHLDKNISSNLFKLMDKYRPETKKEKKERLLREAEKDIKNIPRTISTKPLFLKFGLRHVTNLIEKRKAKLVILANDVEPIDLMLFLPVLCKKMDIPFCVVKNKAVLGNYVNQKKVTCIAFTDIKKGQDTLQLENLTSTVRKKYNERKFTKWGGGIIGNKTKEKLKKQQKLLEKGFI